MLERVKSFVADQLGVSIGCIQEETTLEGDLRISDLDTEDFFSKFFTEFKNVTPQDFITILYFTPEMLDPIGGIRRILSRDFRKRHTIKQVGIKHLVYVAECKRWIDVN